MLSLKPSISSHCSDLPPTRAHTVYSQTKTQLSQSSNDGQGANADIGEPERTAQIHAWNRRHVCVYILVCLFLVCVVVWRWPSGILEICTRCMWRWTGRVVTRSPRGAMGILMIPFWSTKREEWNAPFRNSKLPLIAIVNPPLIPLVSSSRWLKLKLAVDSEPIVVTWDREVGCVAIFERREHVGG